MDAKTTTATRAAGIELEAEQAAEGLAMLASSEQGR
jgi:hypothetical protein